MKEVFSVKVTKEEVKKGGKAQITESMSEDEVEDSVEDSSEEEKHYKGES